VAPLNSYAATRAAADLALGEGLRVVRLRPFNHAESSQSEAFVVPAFAREAGHRLPCIHMGTLDSRRGFVDVRDVGSAYVACLRVELSSTYPGCQSTRPA
jgi:GDP-4-dehydro-6-deoxy-D-mannose reductase